MRRAAFPGRMLAAVVAAASLAAGAAAQTAPGTYDGAAAASFESYEFLDPEAVGIERLTLITTPFVYRVRALERLSLQVGGAFAHGALQRTDGSEATLTGPTDTELRASYTFGRDMLVVSAAFLAPTGKSSHTLDEAEVAGTVAADLLPLRISQWGAGGGLSLSTALALPVGDFGVGLALGYTLGRRYDALELPEETWTYRPGDELVFRLGVDRAIGSSAKASVIFNLRRYADDELQDEALLRPGSRVDLTGMYTFAAGAVATGVGYLGVSHRAAGAFAVQQADLPAQDLVFAGAGFRVPLGSSTLVPSAEARLFRRQDGLNQGHLAGIGAALEWPLGTVTLIPTVRTRFGKVVLWEGEESSFRGAELGLALRVGPGR